MNGRIIHGSLLLALCALLVAAGGLTARAQQPQPPAPPEPPYAYHPPPRPFPRQGQDLEAIEGLRPEAQASAAPAPSAIALGQPGLSYRYVRTFGVTGEPYSADGTHLNHPNGIFVDGADALYVVEEKGFRLLKYDASGQNVLILGHAGSPWHHDDFLSYPTETVVDPSSNLWVVINPALKQFDADGNLLQIFPETEPWASGDANDRFNEPRGIAFDSTGRMYVSDTRNHRVQVYDISGGAPAYVATIGVTGSPRSDSSGFDQPAQIAFDSQDRLYVVDTYNLRVQRCAFAGSWACETFFGVTDTWGDDLSHLGWAFGITVDRSDNIYLADGSNARVLKCDTAGTCSLFAGETGVQGSDNAHFLWPADVAVSSSGDVYVSDYNNQRVQKFNGAGAYLGTVGETLAPYLTDASHYNAPWGIGVASDGSIYFTENRGYRLIKLDADGEQEWAFGQAGSYGNGDVQRLGSFWAGPEGNPAVDADGQVYVTDTGNNRIQIFSPAGNLVGTFGSGGDGDYQFACPAGAAIGPANGDIVVLDRCNQRVMVYDSNRIFKAKLGETGVPGEDNAHFNWPFGVAVDASGAIYVADSENHRVQKCTVSGASGTCAIFVGETGVFSSSYAHLHPLAVAVDNQGRVYVVDEWNSRVQVFDSNAAYLTTLGGAWGARSGEMIGPSGVAVDDSGNLYVTDRDNHRVQKFAPGFPGWVQRNINGFGDPVHLVNSLEIFQGQLYAGTWTDVTVDKARVWRTSDGRTWSEFSPAWSSFNDVAFDMLPFGSQLYVGTDNWDWEQETSHGGELWRTDGASWEQVVTGGYGDANNYAVRALASFEGKLYAVTSNGETGAEVWRSSSGDAGTWTQVNLDGFGFGGGAPDITMDVYKGSLYVGIGRDGEGELWRSSDGATWGPVFTSGLGSNNTHVT